MVCFITKLYLALLLGHPIYREIEKKTQQMGLIVNEKKTKYMTVSATQKGRQTQNLESGKQSNLKECPASNTSAM
jgi:hypothetical protein